MDERIKRVMAAVFGVSESEIDDDASPETIEKWDSLRHMNLIIALEEEFGITFDDDQIVELLNFRIVSASIKELL